MTKAQVEGRKASRTDGKTEPLGYIARALDAAYLAMLDQHAHQWLSDAQLRRWRSAMGAIANASDEIKRIEDEVWHG